MEYQRFYGTIPLLPTRIEAQAMFAETQKKKDEEKKQQTEALGSELNRMLAELRAMTANREATMSKFLSQTSIPHRPPFPPPEPPDLAKLFESPLLHTPAIHPRAPFSPNQNQNNQGSSIQQIESSGVKDVMSTTHKADSVFGEETITSNASESSQVSSQVSLYHLPVFDGTLPDCWIVEVDRFFELKQYGNEEKLDIISLSLEGAALKWFRRHRREFTDWADMKRKLMARFRPTYKPDFPIVTNMEKSPRKLYCEEIQESGMRGLCMSYDGSYANGHHLESKKSQIFVVECDDEESFEVREPSEVTVEEIIDKSVDMIREEKSTPENESSLEVSPQILLSQFQVSLSPLEPGRRYHKESLVVVNDLSYDLGCVIGKTIGCIGDSEIGQDNPLDEEEFNRVWEPGGAFIEHDKWQGSEKCHELSIVVRLMQGLPSTRWSYGKVAELTQELQQPKTYLKEIKLKELDKLVACSSVGTEMWLVKCSCEYKIQKLLLFYHSLKVQEKQLFPEDSVELTEVSIIGMRKGLVCDKEKKKLINVEDGIKKDKKLDHNLIALHLQICCCIRGLYRQRGTVYDAENMRLLDTKDGSSEVVAIWEVNHFHVTDFSTTGQKLLLVKEIDKMWYKEDSWLFMQIILKGLCASGVEMETWRVKKSREWLNKLTTATNLAQMFMDHVCKLHGTPQDMLSDRDPTFLIELFRVLRADLSSDTTYEFIFVQPRPAHFLSRLIGIRACRKFTISRDKTNLSWKLLFNGKNTLQTKLHRSPTKISSPRL